ncbi:sugar-binding protein [Dysgonomonas sp. GY75]|uniref:sugar-binding protein n=1 Tax=Dysgonomonas sp. GY75 TaxID=2780419 RepID=UPI001883B158|nr:sugar-binding protein [Dysgonomonas sp. GY75]MBF0648210.1 sugar-binding protein [Dysgonomonas sp. GY75]
MKKRILKAILFSAVFATVIPLTTIAQDKEESKKEKIVPQLVINGTNNTAIFTIDTNDLPNGLPVQITAPNGFSVTPETISATTKRTSVKVTLNSTQSYTEGQLIIRSGDIRKHVTIAGYGTALPAKDLSKSPVYKGNDDKFEKTKNDGFNPTNKGYTIEFRVKADDMEKEFNPYFVDGYGNGLKANVNSGEGQYDTGLALFYGSGKKSISNPVTAVEGGRSRFYNNDGLAHTYRLAVTPDQRLFIFRDGLPVDTVRLADYGTQPDFATGNGDPVENLLKNPGFEGEYTLYKGSTDGLLSAIEGWNIAIADRYCSEQYLVKQELDNTQDINNHILRLRPYKWNQSWGDPQIVQVVDVAPNETYTLSALARGGIRKKEGKLAGKIVISEMQDREKKAEALISSNAFETYSIDYTTSTECKQLRIVLHTGGSGWGEDISPLEIDNIKLTGVSRKYTPKIGFENFSADLEYFTYDLSGAYAPVQPRLNITLN